MLVELDSPNSMPEKAKSLTSFVGPAGDLGGVRWHHGGARRFGHGDPYGHLGFAATNAFFFSERKPICGSFWFCADLKAWVAELVADTTSTTLRRKCGWLRR